MARRLEWQTDGADWPNREASRFLDAGGVRWHVQVAGQGPCLLLLHGTGASTHSWRDLLPLLARDFLVIAPDLPGHAFTRAPDDDALSLPGMARAVSSLLDALAAIPVLIVGHSAGAAVAARLCLDGSASPHAVVSLNGAFLPPSGFVGQLFSPVARLLARTSVMPALFAWGAADPARMARLLRETGSRVDARGSALYRRLASNPGHVAGALTMMARWDLASLLVDLPRLRPHLELVVGGNDRTIPPSQAATVRAMVPGARVVRLPELGHLAHEERPDLAYAEIRRVGACLAPV